MSRPEDKPEPSDNNALALAYKLATAIVTSRKIPSCEGSTILLSNDSNDHVSYLDDGKEIVIVCRVATEYGPVTSTFPLSRVVLGVLGLARQLVEGNPRLVNPNLLARVRELDLDFREVLAVDQAKVDEAVYDWTVGVITQILINISHFSRNAVADTVNFSVIGFLNNTIRESLREYWEELGISYKLDLLHPDRIKKIYENSTGDKRWFLGGRGQTFEPSRLKVVYGVLRKDYSLAKKDFKRFSSSPAGNLPAEEFDKQWLEYAIPTYPNLDPQLLNQIDFSLPNELAKRHLATTTGKSIHTIEKILKKRI